MTTPSEMTSLADRALLASMTMRRAKFDSRSAEFDAASAKGAWGGTPDQQAKRKLCAEELHERAAMFRTAIIDAHDAESGAPSDELLSAAKSWIAQRIGEEAKALAPSLRQPRPAFNEQWSAGDLSAEARVEIESCNAALDAEWGKVERSWTERHWRRAVRWQRAIRRALGLALS